MISHILKKNSTLIAVILLFVALTSSPAPAGMHRSSWAEREARQRQTEGFRAMAIFSLIPLGFIILAYQVCKVTKTNPLKSFYDVIRRQSGAAAAPKYQTLFSRILPGEGLEEINPDECGELHLKVARGPYAEEIVKDLPGYRIHVAFKKEKPDHKMYLCYTCGHFYLVFLSASAVHADNMLLRKVSDPRGASMEVGMDLSLVVKPLVVTGSYVQIPDSLKEIIARSYGIYPVTKNLHAIFVGKGGFCVIAGESENPQDILNLLKFSRELAQLLEEEKSRDVGKRERISDDINQLKNQD